MPTILLAIHQCEPSTLDVLVLDANERTISVGNVPVQAFDTLVEFTGAGVILCNSGAPRGHFRHHRATTFHVHGLDHLRGLIAVRCLVVRSLQAVNARFPAHYPVRSLPLFEEWMGWIDWSQTHVTHGHQHEAPRKATER